MARRLVMIATVCGVMGATGAVAQGRGHEPACDDYGPGVRGICIAYCNQCFQGHAKDCDPTDEDCDRHNCTVLRATFRERTGGSEPPCDLAVTPTASATSTATFTPIFTATATSTATGTATETPSPTVTSSETPIPTPTETAIFTATATSMPEGTATETPTATATETATAIVTFTATSAAEGLAEEKSAQTWRH